VSGDGVRTRPADEFFRPQGGTVLGPGEILTRVRFPATDAYRAVAFEKFRYRQFDAALVSVVCAVRPDGSCRVVVGAVRPRPVVVSGGTTTGSVDPAAVADEVLPAAEATTRLRKYQRELIAVLTRRAVTRAQEHARS
jgi:carbon-monoxide dehydrogenase medium subunit